MFVIIVGCSATGYHLAKLLLVEQHEVIVLEKNLARYERMYDELGSVVMQGDGTDLVDLRRAGITRADTLVAVTDRDETNLVVCQLGKSAFSVERTVATVKDPKNQTIFRVLGVDSVVNVGALVLDTLERSIVESRFNHLANLREPNRFLVSIILPEDAEIVDKSLAAIGQFNSTFVTAVVRGNQPLKPADDLVLRADDEVFAVTSTDEEAALFERLTGV